MTISTASNRIAAAAQAAPRAGVAMPRGLVLLLGAGASVITVAGIRAAAWLVAPTLLALVIVIVVSPVIKWLRGRGVPAWAATLALVLLVYGVLIAFGLVVIVSFAKLAALLSQYGDRFHALVADVTDVMGRLGVGPAQLRYVADALDVGKVLSALGSLLVDLTGMTTSVVFLLALLLFLSVEANGIDRRLLEIAAHRPHASVAMQGFARRTRRYLVTTTIFGLIVAALDAVALAWVGIPLVVLWGLLAFVTNYVPNVGFVLGLLPPALLALVISGWQLMLVVVLVYTAVNFVAQSLIQPRYVGDAVGLSAVTAFMAMAFWAWVLGPLGLLLAIPATLLIMAVLVDIDPRANWVAALTRAPARAGHHRWRRRGSGQDARADA
ncbi:AI-2E family transporter [Kutzneria buriramensis]|uniref:Putative PurR-regulated permease PerM n=1 Tax=Kutzneria buriramensis TaxID=1045776 RepID=A0A3E0H0H4_9PSEU|nr:AI-2E family transporter [Kutzneria buriramensis]REH34920.1 putative PurR-regulated permease PerM [Kutzneria buriramensis]